MITTIIKSDLQEIKRGITILFPNGIVEVRALKTQRKTQSGYYKDREKMARDIASLSGLASGVYVTLNEVNPDLYSRSADTLKPYCESGDLTADKNILRRLWLPVDADAIRESGISSTDAEHEAAKTKAFCIAAFLTDLGFPEYSIIIADSGNGGHVLVRIDLPNDPDSEKLIKNCLRALDLEFSDAQVKIDTAVYNASRIWKAYGSLACKGSNTKERPHRIARLLVIPEQLIPASRAMLEKLAALAPDEIKPTPQTKQQYGQPLDVATWLPQHGVPVKYSSEWEGGTKYILEACPFDASHNGTSAAVLQFPNGALSFCCKHNSCHGKTWADLRKLKKQQLSGLKQNQDTVSPTLAERKPETETVPPRPTGTATLEEVLNKFRTHYELPDTGHIEIMFATIAANFGHGDPVWLIAVAPPSYGKTEPMSALIGLPHIHPVAVLTEASLLSGTPRKEVAQGSKGGLLAEMGEFGILLIKDFGGMLTLQKEVRGSILAALREVYDGSWTRYVGVEGGRKLHWEGKCGLLGAATPNIDQHYAVMASLGERFCFYRMPEGDETKRANKALDNAGHEAEIRAELNGAVAQLFNGITLSEGTPQLQGAEKSKMIALAHFATRCRSVVERDTYSNREIQLVPGAESATRLVKVLALLFRGLLDIGSTRERAWELVAKVAIDSMPALRGSVLKMMLEQQETDEWKTSELATALNYPTNTTRRTLEDLNCYNIVTRTSHGEGTADIWQLSDWTKNTYSTAATLPRIVRGGI